MDNVNTTELIENKQDLRLFFINGYKKLVNSFLLKYNDMSQMEVEDVVSDLMADLFDRADMESQIENLGAYIYRSTQNRIIDYLRRRKKIFSLDKPMELADAENSKTDSGDFPIIDHRFEDQFDSIEIRYRLIKALDELKPQERAIWIATEIDAYHFRELSEMWGIPIGTLLARKHRANAALQKRLHDLKDF